MSPSSLPISSGTTETPYAPINDAGSVAPPFDVLFVDLDGTLHSSDLFAECLVRACGQTAPALRSLLRAALQGKASLKQATAELVTPDIETLPWNDSVLDLIECLRDSGCRIVLATATDMTWARQVAYELGLFDDVIASDGERNLKGRHKLAAIRAWCTEHDCDDFAYAGDSRSDLAVWAEAAEAFVVNASPGVLSALRESHPDACVVERRQSSAGSLLRAMRPVQWLKNTLLFLPLLLAHEVASVARLMDLAIGFAALSLCASAVYLLNDLLDLSADRRHPVKSRRPIAAGVLSPGDAVKWLVVLMVSGFALSVTFLSIGFTGLLGLYVLLTLTYAVWLKREPMADVVMLAGLYTLRVLAGGVAADIAVSEWLLSLSVFLFTSLAFAKRHAELERLRSEGRDRSPGRGYVVDDLSLIRTLGPCSGYMAVLVLALYSQSPQSREMYANAWALWLICPLALFWVSRLWLVAVRGDLNEDPVIFAVRDRVSLLLGAAAAVLLVVAATPLSWSS